MRERAADFRHGVLIHGFGGYSLVAPIVPFFYLCNREQVKMKNEENGISADYNMIIVVELDMYAKV